MKTVVLANQKGGVGKSAIACLLAHWLAAQGHRVLAIDVDHQGNMTKPLTKSGKAFVAPTSAHQIFTDAVAASNGIAEEHPFVLIPSSHELKALEQQREQHNQFARNLRAFLHHADQRFDFCIIDTNPNPDIRVVASLVSADFVLSPIQLNQEALDGIQGLLLDERVGVERIREKLNPKLRFLGILPTMVEPTPYQKENLRQLVASSQIRSKMVAMVDAPTGGADYAFIPKRTAIAKAQGAGQFLAEIKGDTAARDSWREIQPVIARVAQLMGAA